MADRLQLPEHALVPARQLLLDAKITKSNIRDAASLNNLNEEDIRGETRLERLDFCLTYFNSTGLQPFLTALARKNQPLNDAVDIIIRTLAKKVRVSATGNVMKAGDLIHYLDRHEPAGILVSGLQNSIPTVEAPSLVVTTCVLRNADEPSFFISRLEAELQSLFPDVRSLYQNARFLSLRDANSDARRARGELLRILDRGRTKGWLPGSVQADSLSELPMMLAAPDTPYAIRVDLELDRADDDFPPLMAIIESWPALAATSGTTRTPLLLFVSFVEERELLDYDWTSEKGNSFVALIDEVTKARGKDVTHINLGYLRDCVPSDVTQWIDFLRSGNVDFPTGLEEDLKTELGKAWLDRHPLSFRFREGRLALKKLGQM